LGLDQAVSVPEHEISGLQRAALDPRRFCAAGAQRIAAADQRVKLDPAEGFAAQVRRGMAWVYERYMKDPGLNPLQADAKAAKRGLWADSYSKPPWEWREVWHE